MDGRDDIQARAPSHDGAAGGSRGHAVGAIPPQRGYKRYSRLSTEPPDLGALARDAVVSFLKNATIAPIEPEVARLGETEADDNTAPAAPAPSAASGQPRDASGRLTAESAAWRAADASVAALDRIELAAAKIEADIGAAYQAQAELQAKAGTAAEAAVRAAQSSWEAAVTSEESESRVKTIQRRVEHYVTITVILTVIAIIILVLTSVSAY